MPKTTYKNGMPKKVILGHMTYKVIRRSMKEDPELDSSFGYLMLDHGVIVVRDNMSTGQTRKVLLHELLHVIGVQYGNKYNHQVMKQKKDASMDAYEHFFIDLLDDPLLDLMRSNPLLLAFWLAEDDTD